jgi:hypothetical protein
MATKKRTTKPASRPAKPAKPAKPANAAKRKRGIEKPQKKAVVAKKADALTRLRKICLSLPQAAEVEAWGEPTFRVGGKIFAMHSSASHHHGQDRESVWLMSIGIEQDLVIRARPDRYFKPPYVGPSGWIGAYLDRNPPWAEIEELLRDAWRRRAPKKLAVLLGD